MATMTTTFTFIVFHIPTRLNLKEKLIEYLYTITNSRAITILTTNNIYT